MKLSFIKKGLSIQPYGLESSEWVRKLPEGKEFMAEVKIPRNPEFHRKAMVTLRKLYVLAEETAGFDPWRRQLLELSGYCTVTGFADGSVRVDPLSMKYESMDEEEFKQCMTDLYNTFVKTYGDRITLTDLLGVDFEPRQLEINHG